MGSQSITAYSTPLNVEDVCSSKGYQRSYTSADSLLWVHLCEHCLASPTCSGTTSWLVVVSQEP